MASFGVRILRYLVHVKVSGIERRRITDAGYLRIVESSATIDASLIVI